MQAVVVRSARGSVLALAMVLAVGTVHAQEVSASSPVGEGLRAGARPVPPPPPSVPLRSVEPVIPDADFNAAIPRLDVAGDDAELASPARIDRRIRAPHLSEKQAGAKPAEGQAPPLGDPALADGVPFEAIGDAPVRDAELAKPLPPLDQFNVEPVQFAEAEDPDKDREIAYRVKVNGLDEAEKASTARLGELFREFSALRGGDGKAANYAMISARLREDGKLLQRILASEGWHDARVTTRIDRPERGANQENSQNGDAGLTAVLDVVPGQRFTFADIRVDALPTVPPGLIRDNLALKVGEPIVAERVQGAEAQGRDRAAARTAIPSPKSASATSCSIPPLRRCLYPAGHHRPARALWRFRDAMATWPSTPRTHGCSRGSGAVSFTTAARSTTCARRSSPPGCSPPSRSSRSAPGRNRGRRHRIRDHAGQAGRRSAAHDCGHCRLWHRRRLARRGELDAPQPVPPRRRADRPAASPAPRSRARA
jgi:hypothetical protein